MSRRTEGAHEGLIQKGSVLFARQAPMFVLPEIVVEEGCFLFYGGAVGRVYHLLSHGELRNSASR